MNESVYGPQTRRRAAVAVALLAGFILALFPVTTANAAAVTAVKLTSPVFNDTYSVGTPMTITWLTNATSGNATIELWRDNSNVPAKATDITTAVAAKAGKYVWQVPTSIAVGTDYFVKITIGAANDVSDQFLAFALPSVAVSSPKLGDAWSTGTQKLVKWSTKVTGNVDVYLADTSDNPIGSALRSNVSASTGTFNWDIPVGVVTASGTYHILVRSHTTPAIKGASADFTLNLATVHVDTPNSAASYGAGTVVPIKWTAKLPGKVKIELVDVPGATATQLALVSATPATYNWTVSPSLPLGTNQYKIRITSVSPGTTVNANVTDDSDVAFSVTAPTLSVTQPDASVTGGSAWLAGSSHKITWSAAGLAGNVKLELADSGGSVISGKTIKTSVAASAGSYTWDIPAAFITASGTYKVKLTTISTAPVSVTSSAFDLNLPTIGVPGLTGTPTIGGSVGITWTTTMPSGTVKLEYVDGGNVAKLIKSGVTAKAGSFTWAIPATLTAGTYKIRVTSIANPLVTNQDTGTAFSLGTVTVGTPSTGTAGGSAVALSWTTSVSGTWNIALADSNGSVIKTIKSAQAGTSYSWAVPLNFITASGSYQIKVSNAANSAINDLSGTFTINLPTITVTQPPGGGATWNAGSHTVQWSGLTVGSVKIELYNGATLVSMLKSSVTASANSAVITIPGTLTATTTYTIKVTSLSNTAIVGTNTFVAS